MTERLELFAESRACNAAIENYPRWARDGCEHCGSQEIRSGDADGPAKGGAFECEHCWELYFMCDACWRARFSTYGKGWLPTVCVRCA